MDPAYQLDETFSWFMPGKRGDHDLKFGASYLYPPLHVFDAGNMNGTFILGSDLEFDAANSAHLSGTLLGPRAGDGPTSSSRGTKSACSRRTSGR